MIRMDWIVYSSKGEKGVVSKHFTRTHAELIHRPCPTTNSNVDHQLGKRLLD